MTKVVVYQNQPISEKPPKCKNWRDMHKFAKVPLGRSIEIPSTVFEEALKGDDVALASIRDILHEHGISHTTVTIGIRKVGTRYGFKRVIYNFEV